MNRFVACCLLAGACGVDDETDAASELHHRGPRLVEAGAVTLLEVTDDNYAIYQSGQRVFASPLGHAAPAEPIAEVAAGNTAFVFQVGRVAFVWTNPNRSVPGFGVSPLVIWSARTGANLASEASAIGTLATSASRDGDLVLFTSNSSADGTTGDLELASTDLTERRTIAAGIPMGFPAGPCAPRAAFLTSDRVAGVTCPAGSANARLSFWRGDERVDFAEPITTPIRLWLDTDRGQVATMLAGSRNPVVVDRHAQQRFVVADTSATNIFLAGDGALLYLGQPSPTTGLREAFRSRKGGPPTKVADVFNINFFGFGSVGISTPVTSPDGRFLSYFDTLDRSVGLATNVLLADLRGGDPPVTLDTSTGNGLFGVAFTRDSDHTMFARVDLVSFAVGPMFEAGRRGVRQFSDELGWSYDPAFGSTITYNDRTTLDPNNVFLSTADLKAVDLDRAELAPRLIAAGANVTYFASHRGRGVVFTIDSGASAGLYVAPVR